MAIYEDILGVTIIIITFLVVMFMISSFVVVKEVQVLTQEQQNYLEDYYSYSIDTFLSTISPSTNKPFSLVIAEIIDETRKDKERVINRETINEINETLNHIIGENNFYLEIIPRITNLTISFIFPGSNSLNEARELFNQSLENIKNTLEQNLTDGEVGIEFYIYNIHNNNNLCNQFSVVGIDCMTLNETHLYNNHIVTRPNFSFNDYEGWFEEYGKKESYKSVLNNYIQHDWASAMVFAHEQFENNPISNESFHVIIPISDQLSTSSISDDCFNYNGLPSAIGACFLCDNDCESPTIRSRRDFNNIINFINESIIIPVIYEECYFDYIDFYFSLKNMINENEFKRDPPDGEISFNLTEDNLPFNKTSEYICNATNIDCPGCTVENHNVCYKHDCLPNLTEQMKYLASETNGEFIDDFDLDELPEQIISLVNVAIRNLKIDVGNPEILNESTRFAFERTVILPDNTRSEFITIVRDTPFTREDSTWHSPPVQPVGITILKPSPGNQFPSQKIELKVRSTHNSDCRYTNDKNENFNEMESLKNIGNNLHNISYIVDFDETYTIYFQCNGTSETYNLSEKKNVTFKILENRCENYGYSLCDECADYTQNEGYFPNLNETKKCCLNCAVCEGYSQCGEDEFCKNNKWSQDFDNDDRCCQTECGSCNDENHYFCEEGFICNVEEVTWGNETCCPEKCQNCTELNGEICEENNFCTEWEKESIECCKQNKCKNCTELDGEICEADEFCENDDYHNELGTCCTSQCLNCSEAGGINCPTGTENLECKNWIEFSIMCCEENKCSNCSNEGLNVCNNNQKCVGNIITWEQDCCEGTCKVCNELSENHKICEENKVCDGDYDNYLSNCCEGTCKECNEIGFFCNENQGCTGDWINFEKRCCDSECHDFIVEDTICNSYWDQAGTAPYDGNLILINEWNPSCALFDVLHPGLVEFVLLSKNCCLDQTANGCYEPIAQASRSFAEIDGEPNDDELKKCMGRYIIYALGPGKQFAEHYFYQEGCCGGIKSHCGNVNIGFAEKGTCNTNFNTIENPSKNGVPLECVDPGELQSPPQYPRAWKDNQDWTKNSCYFSDLPASVSLMELQTGQCVDYSVMATTLLRVAGYKEDEVYTLLGPGHAFNIIKFPGDDKFKLFDTTGNSARFNQGNMIYYQNPKQGITWKYCDYIINPNNAHHTIRNFICTNDNGGHTCPLDSEVKGC